ncbi:MAG: hypothetical protein ACLFSE_11965 [Spirochaetia bacterium]
MRLTPSLFTNYNGDDGFTDVTVNNAAEDNQNRLWIAAVDGLYCLENGRFIENDLTRELKGIRVKHVMVHDKKLYVSTISPLGVVVYTDGTVHYLNKKNGLPGNVIKKNCRFRGEYLDFYLGRSHNSKTRGTALDPQ